MPEYAIEIVNLTKQYGRTEALAGLNLRVPTGSITGFLGRNGAGKTTAIKTLLGMTRPTSGRASVLGYRCDVPADSVEIRRRTGFVSEDKDLYDYMTVEQHLRFVRGFFPEWRDDLVRRFDLPLRSKVKALSKGMAAGGMVFLGVATCLSALFTDFWKPLLIAIAVEFMLAIIRPVLTLPLIRTEHSHVGLSLGFPPPSYVWYNVYGVMDAQSYFRHGTLPWAGLAVNLAAALVLLYASGRILARRDF